MYRDVAQWLDIRHRILVQGSLIRRVASEKGILVKTSLLSPINRRRNCGAAPNIGAHRPAPLFAKKKFPL